jgi:hypothetical protein
MLGCELPARTCGHSHNERDIELTAGHVEDRRGVVHDLIEREQTEVHGHDLHDGPQARHGRTDASADEGRFGQGRVPDALGAELLEEPKAHRETTSVPTDVLSHEEHPIVPQERFPKRCPHGLAVGESLDLRSGDLDGLRGNAHDAVLSL